MHRRADGLATIADQRKERGTAGSPPSQDGRRRCRSLLSPAAVAVVGAAILAACSSSSNVPVKRPAYTPYYPAASAPAPTKPATTSQRPTLATSSAVTSAPLQPPGATSQPNASTAPANTSAATGSRAVQSVPLPPPSSTSSVRVATAAMQPQQSASAAPAARPAATAAPSSSFAINRPQQTAAEAKPSVGTAPITEASATSSAPATSTNPEAPDEVIGSVSTYAANYEDTLLDIAIDNDLGYQEIVAANQGIDPWLPGSGTKIVLPKANILPKGPRNGILINLAENRLYYFQKGQFIKSFPIGVFREGFATPIGSTKIVRKQVDPTWYPTASSREEHPELPAVVPPGPENPLGSRAMYLGWARYIIHGTNKPYGVGRRVSHGCIRMQPADVEELFSMVPVGTPVNTTNQTVMLGWWGGELFIQAHPTMAQGISLEETGKLGSLEVPDVHEMVTAKAGPYADRVDWTVVETALKERRGIPVQITKPQAPVAAAPAATAPVAPAAAAARVLQAQASSPPVATARQ